jgi:hypothetical protein
MYSALRCQFFYTLPLAHTHTRKPNLYPAPRFHHLFSLSIFILHTLYPEFLILLSLSLAHSRFPLSSVVPCTSLYMLSFSHALYPIMYSALRFLSSPSRTPALSFAYFPLFILHFSMHFAFYTPHLAHTHTYSAIRLCRAHSHTLPYFIPLTSLYHLYSPSLAHTHTRKPTFYPAPRFHHLNSYARFTLNFFFLNFFFSSLSRVFS